MGKSLTLILGGARGGKSSYAQTLAATLGEHVLFIATAEAVDAEMSVRIARHRAERPAHWRTLEVPCNVGMASGPHVNQAEVVLLDCLTLLVSNILVSFEHGPEEAGSAVACGSRAAQASRTAAGHSVTQSTTVKPYQAEEVESAVNLEIEGLLDAHRASTAHWIVVSNEVGLGLVPAYPLGRIYRDLLGRANQRLASAADKVLFMVAGLPMPLKDTS